MTLSPGVILAGKYFIQQLIDETEHCYVYSVNSPILGEEFVAMEFFPRASAVRDENDYVVVLQEKSEEYEKQLDKFTHDAAKLMHMTANRYFGVKEVIPEKGTTFIISAKPSGEALPQYFQENPEAVTLNDPIIDNLYECIKSIFQAEIYVGILPETFYIDKSGSFILRFNFLQKQTEDETIISMAKLMYYLVTRQRFEVSYKPNLIDRGALYGEVLVYILEKNNAFMNFSQIDKTLARRARLLGPGEPLRAYYKSAIFLIIIIVITAVAIIYGMFYITGVVLG